MKKKMYKSKFKKFGGEYIPDIIEYLKDYLSYLIYSVLLVKLFYMILTCFPINICLYYITVFLYWQIKMSNKSH